MDIMAYCRLPQEVMYRVKWYSVVKERLVQDLCTYICKFKRICIVLIARYHQQPVPEYGANLTSSELFWKDSQSLPKALSAYLLRPFLYPRAGNPTTHWNSMPFQSINPVNILYIHSKSFSNMMGWYLPCLRTMSVSFCMPWLSI